MPRVLQSTVEYLNVLVAEGTEHPPESGGGVGAVLVVIDDDVAVRLYTEVGDGLCEGVYVGQGVPATVGGRLRGWLKAGCSRST